jgi:hypothetical protein
VLAVWRKRHLDVYLQSPVFQYAAQIPVGTPLRGKDFPFWGVCGAFEGGDCDDEDFVFCGDGFGFTEERDDDCGDEVLAGLLC